MNQTSKEAYTDARAHGDPVFAIIGNCRRDGYLYNGVFFHYSKSEGRYYTADEKEIDSVWRETNAKT